MITDAALLVANAQALAGAKAYASENYIDRSQTKELGAGLDPLMFVLNVDAACTSSDDDVGVMFILQSDDNSSFSSPTYLRYRHIPFASLTAGARLPLFAIPRGTTEQYLRVYMISYQTAAPWHTAGDHNFAGTVTISVPTSPPSNDAGTM